MHMTFAGLAIFVLLAYLLPYFHLRRWKRLGAEEAVALSFGAASLLFGATAFIAHAVGISQKAAHLLVLAALAVSVLPHLRTGFAKAKREISLPYVGIFLAFLTLIMALEASFPVYVGGFWYFDWWQHYNVSQLYLGKVPHDYLWLGMYNFASRTPLMNLNAAFFLAIFGDAFWVYQIVASLLNSTFILPTYLICRRLSGARMAMLMCALLFLSPSVVHNAWYPWPKLFSAYFVLLAAHFYLRKQNEKNVPDTAECILIFALVWAGFLAHQASLFFSIVILLHMFYRLLKNEPKRLLPVSLTCLLCFIMIDGVWLAWATSFFGIKRSFLSYYERPATVGGVSGYLIVFTYHMLATICSPLFLYELARKQPDFMQLYGNVQALYYNSIVGFATISVFVAVLIILARKAIRGKPDGGYAEVLFRPSLRRLLVFAGIWCAAMATLVALVPGFGEVIFTRYFNHPEFARKMFGAFFAAGACGLITASAMLWLFSRARRSTDSKETRDSAGGLLGWMAIAGYAGCIATHHELYIHGMVSAGCAASVVLTVLFLARVCSDAPRAWRCALAFPVFCENFLIVWLPLLVVKYNWGWSGEKNWALKTENSLVFMADLFPNAWSALAFAGVVIQIAMLLLWVFAERKEEN